MMDYDENGEVFVQRTTAQGKEAEADDQTYGCCGEVEQATGRRGWKSRRLSPTPRRRKWRR